MRKDLYQWHLDNCRRLRSACSKADIDYFMGMVEWEDNTAAWKVGVAGDGGWPTFLDCLFVSNVAMAHRYEKFKRMVEVCGSVERVREIGLDAAETLLKVPDDVPSIERPNVNARQAVYEEYAAHRRRNKQPVSKRHARSMQAKHFRKQTNVSIGPVNEFDRNKAKVRTLERESKKDKDKIRELEAKLAAVVRHGLVVTSCSLDVANARIRELEAKLVVANARIRELENGMPPQGGRSNRRTIRVHGTA